MSEREPVILQAEGMNNFADGRDFVVRAGEVHTYGPHSQDNEPYELRFNGEKLETTPVSSDASLTCDPCYDRFEGDKNVPYIFKRTVVSHNIWWMYTALSCPAHIEGKVYLDIFPKINGGGYGEDWNNAFPHLDTREGLLGRVTVGFSQNDDESTVVGRMRAQAEARFLLTPEGVIPDNRRAKSIHKSYEAEMRARNKSIKPGWTRRLGSLFSQSF